MQNKKIVDYRIVIELEARILIKTLASARNTTIKKLASEVLINYVKKEKEKEKEKDKELKNDAIL